MIADPVPCHGAVLFAAAEPPVVFRAVTVIDGGGDGPAVPVPANVRVVDARSKYPIGPFEVLASGGKCHPSPLSPRTGGEPVVRVEGEAGNDVGQEQCGSRACAETLRRLVSYQLGLGMATQ